MAEQSNRIRLIVGGIEYMITTEDDEAYIQDLGAQLNRQLDQISKESPFLSTAMVSAMAALKNLDAAKKEARLTGSLRAKIKELTEQAACAQLEADDARREVERLSEENRRLRAADRR